MEYKDIIVGNAQYDRIFVGNSEVGFGFVGNKQFFGQLLEHSEEPTFRPESVFGVSGVVGIDTEFGYGYLVDWYYNDTKSLDGATKTELEGTSITLGQEFLGKYLCAKVTLLKQYYYGSKEFVIYSPDRITDNRQERTIRINGIQTTMRVNSIANLLQVVISPSTKYDGTPITVDDIVIEQSSDNLITLSTSGNRIYATINTNGIELGTHTLKLSIDGDTLTKPSSVSYSINVVGTTILNPTVTITKNPLYGDIVNCNASCDTEDVNKSYVWKLNGNIIEGATLSTLYIDNVAWISQKLSCEVTFTKQLYSAVIVQSNQELIDKGNPVLRLPEDISDPIIVKGNDNVIVPYTISGNNTEYYISTINNDYFTIINNTSLHQLIIDGKDVQMTDVYRVTMYARANDCYNESNPITFNIKTLQVVWDGLMLNLDGNLIVGNDLTLNIISDGQTEYEPIDIKWYVLQDPEDTPMDFIVGENTITLPITEDYWNKYIGCEVLLKNNDTEEVKRFNIVSGQIFKEYTVSGDIYGNPYYAQKLMVNSNIIE